MMSRKTELSKRAEIAGIAVGITAVFSTFATLLLAGNLYLPSSNTPPNDNRPPADNVPAPADHVTSAALSDATPLGLEGTWRQYVDGRSLADFTVKINMETGQYEMSLINRSARSTGTRGISNIQYDGRTWSFDSDWGYKIARFALKKVDDNTFVGIVERNQHNRWVRMRSP